MSRALGRYELLRPLARGGMAEVFLARRRAAGVEKVLVVKRIRPERANDVEFLDLFVREARLSMSLAHQNIVPVFDFGRAGDQVYFTMEHVEGKDLGSSLARAGGHRLPPVVAAFIAAECCQALDYAHHRERDGARLGIVHRDVTPRNVLVSWSGEVKLTDFGIAALAGDATTRLIGTPAYMAPEQAHKQPVDARADIYSVGLVLREALTGERARKGGDREALLAAATTGVLAPWPDGIDPALVAIVDRATARDPADRYSDAHAVLGELDAYIVGARAAQRGDPPARQLARWLATVWEGEREDSATMSSPELHLESLFDDEIDAIGTGTERSLLVTAAEAGELAAEPTPAPAKPAPRRWPWLAALLALVALAAGAAVFVQSRRGPEVASIALDYEETQTSLPSATSGSDDPPPPEPVEIDEPAAAPTRIVAPPSPPAAPATRYTVLVGSNPWAFFTVDDDMTKHETPERVQLPAGVHRFHFWNPPLNLDKTVRKEITGDMTITEQL